MSRVVITGVGAVTSLGHSVSEIWSNILRGKSGVIKVAKGDRVLQNSRDYNLALVTDFDHQMWKVPHVGSRMNSFLHAAAEQAIKSSRLTFKSSDVVGVNIGTMSSNISKLTQFISATQKSGPEMINRLTLLHILGNIPGASLSVKYKLKGPISTTTAACATGLASIGQAYSWILNNDAEYAIAGGVEDVYNSTCLYSSIKLQAMTTREDMQPQQVSRPFDKGRSGFVLGEGAGVVVLENYESALRRKAKIYGQIVGYGCFSDGYHLTQPDPQGAGAYRAMQIALEKAGVQSSYIDHVNCHATSTPVGDQAEAKAISRLLRGHEATLTALKSYFGHSFGAAGAIELIVGLMSMEESMGVGILNLKEPVVSNLNFLKANEPQSIRYFLKNAFGFGGVNCSMLIKKHEPLQ